MSAAAPPESNPYQRAILGALNVTQRHIYRGTVPPATIAKRRKRNRMAKASRRANR